MADFISCDTKSYSFLTILASLFAELTASGVRGVRVESKTADTDNPIECTTHDTFVQLFRRAMDVGTDGYVTLRICLTTAEGGDGLQFDKECGMEKSIDLLMRRAFVLTTDGDVALNLWNIT